MNIREMNSKDINDCADILCSVYNNELWMCRWDKETAVEYLKDFFESKRFVGYVAEEDGRIIAGIFAHEKIWWNNSEVFIEEMFVNPARQGKGIGTALLNTVEEYVKNMVWLELHCPQTNMHRLQNSMRKTALWIAST